MPIHDDDRVPDELRHTLTVRSQNGVPVVVERWNRSGSPSPRNGFSATLGSPVTATRWLSAVGTTSPGERLARAPGDPQPRSDGHRPGHASPAPAPSQELRIAGLEDVEVPAAGLAVIDLGQHVNRGDLQLIITSTRPVVVERGVFGSAGFSQSILVPSLDQASIAEVDTGAASVPPVTVAAGSGATTHDVDRR